MNKQQMIKINKQQMIKINKQQTIKINKQQTKVGITQMEAALLFQKTHNNQLNHKMKKMMKHLSQQNHLLPLLQIRILQTVILKT